VFNAVIDVPDVGKVEFSAVNTGVPHAVIFVDNVDGIDARKLGRLIRQHTIFPKGVNVDFAEVVNSNTIRVRTYERGVEDETLCCGTGATAVAVIATLLGKVRKNEELMLRFRGGTLLLKVLVAGENVAKVTMMGTAHKIFEGLYNPD
jgi:diaminopimelate epimerase